MIDISQIERRLSRLESKRSLHGDLPALVTEIEQLLQQLEQLEQGAAEDWLMDRDRELGRAFRDF